jgi:hypothetical protein
VTGIAEFRSRTAGAASCPRGTWYSCSRSSSCTFYAALALVGVLATAWRRKLRLAEGLLFVLFFYVWWSGQKNFGYLVVATFPWCCVAGA